MTQSLTLQKLLEKLQLGEGVDFEVKLASQGLPSSVWETFSAFANTLGGYIVLGIRQSKDNYFIEGVPDTAPLIKQFWDLLNNPNKVSSNFLTNEDIKTYSIDGRQIIVIHVSVAPRHKRPVYISGNPYTGTYKRHHEGDYVCEEGEVKRLLRDASDEPFDKTVIKELGVEAFDQDSINQFKNRFSARSPGHPFLAKDQKDFLQAIGAWDHDLRTKREGPTLAGLLMFGKENIIKKVHPYYFLDYQEILTTDPDTRWTHRISLDGTWEGNLFQFSQKVFARLVSDLDVPFKVDKDAVRLDESRVHEALREALINTLIHADHSASKNIKILKKKDHFLFINPGRLRIPLRSLYQGGTSDCRNPALQRLFGFLGWGERAGSGFQKILQAWRGQNWVRPFVHEDIELGTTVVLLSLISIIPEKISHDLIKRFGNDFVGLSELERSLLIWTSILECSKNETLQQYHQEHPTEITRALGRLVDQGFLETTGKGRGTSYKLTDHPLSIEHLEGNFEHLKDSIEHLEKNSIKYMELWGLTDDIRKKKKVAKGLIMQRVLEVCKDQFVSLKLLSDLLNRKFDTLRNHYINPLVKDGKLASRYPEKPRHPGQAYKTKG